MLPLPRGGLEGLFYPGAEVVHVGGASMAAACIGENVRGHLRFLAKHRGPREAERTTELLLGARLRAVLYRGERGQTYREAARWLASGSVGPLLKSPR